MSISFKILLFQVVRLIHNNKKQTHTHTHTHTHTEKVPNFFEKNFILFEQRIIQRK